MAYDSDGATKTERKNGAALTCAWKRAVSTATSSPVMPACEPLPSSMTDPPGAGITVSSSAWGNAKKWEVGREGQDRSFGWGRVCVWPEPEHVCCDHRRQLEMSADVGEASGKTFGKLIWETLGKHQGNVRENIRQTSGKHQANIGKTSGKHRGNIGETSGKHQEDIRRTAGKHQGNIRETSPDSRREAKTPAGSRRKRSGNAAG